MVVLILFGNHVDGCFDTKVGQCFWLLWQQFGRCLHGGFDNNLHTVWMVVLAVIRTPFGWMLLTTIWSERHRLDGCFDIELREQKNRDGDMHMVMSEDSQLFMHKNRIQCIDSRNIIGYR